jgi:hypothetical protein
MKAIEISDYMYGLLEEERTRRLEDGWQEGVTVDRVASEGLAFYFGYDIMPTFFDLDNRWDAFKERPTEDIDHELKEGIEAVVQSNREYERGMKIA